LLQQEGLNPPNTWQDSLAIAKHFYGKDLNGDGTPDFGSCISTMQADQAYHMVWSVAGAFIQTQGIQQGAFFDADTMKPLVNNEALAASLDIFKEAASYGSPDESQHNLHETRSLFVSGRCALTLDWGDIGTLVIDPQTSRVIDRVGAQVLPGSSRVLDRATGKLVDCTKITCPYAVEGVNHAPYAAFDRA
jgi:multiple sugar transport system substrate-binding protein